MNKEKIIIILGPPGSGKGTQAKMICDKFDLKYIGSGASLRKRKEESDFTGKKLEEVLKKGELVPNFIIIKMLANELEEIKKNGIGNGFVLDGWTRIKTEAILTDEALKWYEWNQNVKVFLIKISNEEALNRLTKRKQCKICGRIIPFVGEFKNLEKCDKCGGELVIRKDDNEESIKVRLNEYKKETIQSLDYYRESGKLIEINGEQSIEEVFNDILKYLE